MDINQEQTNQSYRFYMNGRRILMFHLRGLKLLKDHKSGFIPKHLQAFK